MLKIERRQSETDRKKMDRWKTVKRARLKKNCSGKKRSILGNPQQTPSS